MLGLLVPEALALRLGGEVGVKLVWVKADVEVDFVAVRRRLDLAEGRI
jgi:hypothetical protein